MGSQDLNSGLQTPESTNLTELYDLLTLIQSELFSVSEGLLKFCGGPATQLGQFSGVNNFLWRDDSQQEKAEMASRRQCFYTRVSQSGHYGHFGSSKFCTVGALAASLPSTHYPLWLRQPKTSPDVAKYSSGGKMTLIKNQYPKCWCGVGEWETWAGLADSLGSHCSGSCVILDQTFPLSWPQISLPKSKVAGCRRWSLRTVSFSQPEIGPGSVTPVPAAFIIQCNDTRTFCEPVVPAWQAGSSWFCAQLRAGLPLLPRAGV